MDGVHGVMNASATEDAASTVRFVSDVGKLLSEDRYLSVRDYASMVSEGRRVFNLLSTLRKAGALDFYCSRSGLDTKVAELFLDLYTGLQNDDPSIISRHNEDFLQRHLEEDRDYLDAILSKADSSIMLDEEQRRVVLSDEDHTLVVAGAGAGKTTTIAAKVRYLTERMAVSPEQILVVSFTNKAVGELRERINHQLGIPCPVTTFHSIGYAIIRSAEADRKMIVSDGFLYDVISDYLKERILGQKDMVEKLIMFFGSYFDVPCEEGDAGKLFEYISRKEFSTIRSDIGDYVARVIDSRTGRKLTIKSERVRSREEVQIANFLYLNGLDYEYEQIYPFHILKSGKPYTPDFTIRQGDRVCYLEHFGITEDGRNNAYSDSDLERYRKAIDDKIRLHRKHGTRLVHTFSKYNDGRELLDHLGELLVSEGFVLRRLDSAELYRRIVETEENRYITPLVRLMVTFISNFKTFNFGDGDFDRMQRLTSNVRTRLFLEICHECYLEYTRQLKARNAVSFADMINDSARILSDMRRRGERLDYRYIIVDEYQDISHQRFDLVRELESVCDAKVMAVGDDWQSIYAYAGSDITLFTQFREKFRHARELKITRTYRNSQEVIDIAGNFIQKNASQIRKSLVSPKHIDHPVIVMSYDETGGKKQSGKDDDARKRGKNAILGEMVERAIGDIREKWRGAGRAPSILLIGRYGFDARNLCYSSAFNYDERSGKVVSRLYPRAHLEFLTAHRSKGLGYDEVIIVNAKDETYGFPSQIDDDPVLKLVTVQDGTMEYAEERRLFYVAMTRTRNRIYIVTPEQRPSMFVLELLKDYANITLVGKLGRVEARDRSLVKKCPVCGFPLQMRYNRNFGLRLWMCTNEPEVCDFMSNDLRGGRLSILKCDQCRDGYLIVKRDRNGEKDPFLGCTKYQSDGTGCNSVVTEREYYDLMGRPTATGFSELRPELSDAVGNGKGHHFKLEESKPRAVDKVPASARSSGKSLRLNRNTGVNFIKWIPYQIGELRFEIAETDGGQRITDTGLLEKLCLWRQRIADEKGVPVYGIVSNRGLVSVATYRPISREEFVRLDYLSDKVYEAYGDELVKMAVQG